MRLLAGSGLFCLFFFSTIAEIGGQQYYAAPTQYGAYQQNVVGAQRRQLMKKKSPSLPLEEHHVIPIQHVEQHHEKVLVPSEVQSVTVQNIVKEKSCPIGFVLQHNKCVKTEIVAPKMICPPSTTMINGRCAVFSRARKDCPHGYTLSGGRCTMMQISPAQFTCPDGSVDHSGHGCHVTIAEPPRCPSGYDMDHHDGMCTLTTPAQLQCPEGYMHHKKGCIRDASFEASPMCPVGSQLVDGKKCTSLKKGSPKCPKGYSLDTLGMKCVKHVHKKEKSCPAGYSKVKSKHAHHFCEKVHAIPAQLICPPEAHLDPSIGHCAHEIPQPLECPHGFKQGKTPHTCIQVADEVAICPKGTVPVGHDHDMRCQSTIEHDIIQCCPPGFDLIAGKCERIETFRPVMSCTDCVKIHKSQPVFNCPPAFNIVGHRCFRVVSSPCAPKAHTVHEELCDVKVEIPVTNHNYAPPHYDYPGASLRALKEEHVQHVIEKRPCHKTPVPVKMCKSEEVIPAEVVCPPNAILEGGVCVERQMLIPEPICKMGILDTHSGECVRVTSVPMKTECLPGTTRIGDRCVEYSEHAPDFVCPKGTVSDGGLCVIRAPAIHPPAKVIHSPPMHVCPEGQMEGLQCVVVDRVPLALECPPGSIHVNSEKHKGKKGSCYYTADFIMPKDSHKHTKPKYICPDGQPAKGHHCHSHESVDPSPICPEGTKRDSNNQCILRMPAIVPTPKTKPAVGVPGCPHGSVLQGSKCVSALETDAHIICPPGYEIGHGMGDKECIRMSEHVPNCPHGTTHTADGCLKQHVTEPMVKVVSKCSKEHGLCDVHNH